MPPVYTALAERDGVGRAVSDYLSSMTDPLRDQHLQAAVRAARGERMKEGMI